MASRKKIKNITKEAKSKRSFRNSSKWKDFRKKKYDDQGGRDYITLKPLTKSFHCHHGNLNVDEYENLEDDANFLAVNSSTHKMIHWCLRYVKAYGSLEIMERLLVEVKREALLNGLIEGDD